MAGQEPTTCATPREDTGSFDVWWESHARRVRSDDFKGNGGACERFLQWFERSGMTKADLARMLGVSEPAAARYVRDPSKMSLYASEKLERELGCSHYCDIVHGWGTWDELCEAADRGEAVERLLAAVDGMGAAGVNGMADLLEAARGLRPERVRALTDAACGYAMLDASRKPHTNGSE